MLKAPLTASDLEQGAPRIMAASRFTVLVLTGWGHCFPFQNVLLEETGMLMSLNKTYDALLGIIFIDSKIWTGHHCNKDRSQPDLPPGISGCLNATVPNVPGKSQ